MKEKAPKHKTTFTYTQELLDTVRCISTISNKNKNEVIEEAFWEWWKLQEEKQHYEVNVMKDLLCNKQKNSR